MSMSAPGFSVSSYKLMIYRSPILTALLLLFFSWPTKKGLWLGKAACVLSVEWGPHFSMWQATAANIVLRSAQRRDHWDEKQREILYPRICCAPDRGVAAAILFPEGISGAELLQQSLQRLCSASPPPSVLSALFLNAPSFGPSTISVTESNMYRLYDRWHSFQSLLSTMWYLRYFVPWIKFLKYLRYFCLEDSYS